MSMSSDPPPAHRDLATDEPDLPSDGELDQLTPLLPNLETHPIPPMEPVRPGPETPMSQASDQVPEDSLEDMADAVGQGRLPGDDA